MIGKTTTRVQMELPESSIQRLKTLKEKTEANSYAEVTKNAYRIYDEIITLTESGYVFFLRDHKGDMKELKLFI